MKIYSYKIQWCFQITGNFMETKDVQRKLLFNFIKSIGAKSLDVINFLDKDFKKIDSYRGFIQYPYGSDSIETIKHIKKMLKTNENITNIELLRR